MRDFLRRRVLLPIRALLLQGITPQKLALSIAIGGVVGIFPVLGVTAVSCTIVAIALRLNLLAVHSVHYAMTPVQILLIIPFVRVGEHLTGAAPQPLSIREGTDLIAGGVMNAISVLWDAIIHAVIGWLAIGPVAIVGSYFLIRWALLRFMPPPRPAPV